MESSARSIRARQTSAEPRAFPVSVAPMMDWTDSRYRRFMRSITRRTPLYTEMITTHAILRGERHLQLKYDALEKPLVAQLGGDSPRDLAECARIVADYGYDEVNLNVGCPSERVQSGSFGACLMATPELVGECLGAMAQASALPVSIKHRIGIDGRESYEDLARFVEIVAAASGVRRFVVHARIAVLKGLSPRENRSVPPLRYADVHQLKRDFPQLQIEINGGFRDLRAAQDQLTAVDGVMIGRAAYETPWIFSAADPLFFGAPGPAQNRAAVIEALIEQLEELQSAGVPLRNCTRHTLGLFNGEHGARHFRRTLTENRDESIAPRTLLGEATRYLRETALYGKPAATAAPATAALHIATVADQV